MKPKTIYISLTTLLSILFSCMFYLMPLSVDDLWYLRNSTGSPGSLEYFITTVENCADHWKWDTGRFSNMAVAPFLSLFPRWIFAAVSGVAVWSIYYFGVILCKAPWISVRSVIWIAVVTFVLPWFEYFFTIVYCSNYIWALALGLIYLYLFFHEIRNTNLWKLTALIIFSYIVGWWHEGFSVPISFGIAMYFLYIRRWPSRIQWLMGVALVMGILTIMAMPAFYSMTESRESFLIKTVLIETLINVLAFNCMFYCLIISTVFALTIRKVRLKMLSNRTNIAFIILTVTFGLFATVLYIKYFNGARTGAFAQIICTLGFLRLLPYFRTSKVKHRVRMCAFLSVSILSIINLIWAVKVQTVLSEEFAEVTELRHKASAKGEKFIYFDCTPIQMGVDFLKPSYMLLNTYYGLGGDFTMIPTSLRGVCLNNSNVKKCRDQRLRIAGKNIIAVGKIPQERIDVILYLNDGSSVRSRTRFREYVTACGDTCCVVIPHLKTVIDNLEVLDAELTN